MRVLCCVSTSVSHARALLPVARVLAHAGHEVRMATTAPLLRVFDGEPFRARPDLPAPFPRANESLADLAGALTGEEDDIALAGRMSARLFAGPHITDGYRALAAVAERFRPDLVLRGGAEFAAVLLAEHLGVPHVSAPSGSANALPADDLLSLLNARNLELARPGWDDLGPLHRHGRLDFMPARYPFTPPDLPAAITYRQPDTVARGEVLPDWVLALPADRPLVLASIGTVIPKLREQATDPFTVGVQADALSALLAVTTALGDLDCVGVVATGGLVPADSPAPGHVRLVDHFPQPLLLRCAQLFITHGGYNSIRESVVAGVPMAVLPRFGDQFANADRVDALGLGLRVTDGAAEGIAAVCRTLLTDPAAIARARLAQRHMLALPPIEDLVPRLEQVAGRGAGAGIPEQVGADGHDLVERA
ncbi:glycosyltransferase family 1 protein [Saccharothrix algeriensis]|uniref:Glycosyltransferase family 1 protein n=1 Tax=Saccharothrix algeriensis TaxID=173560 RepID=A0A8T8I088_9PSEU|nr:glycosyltransferase family 1 protein [Saccharothrix algeriensis]